MLLARLGGVAEDVACHRRGVLGRVRSVHGGSNRPDLGIVGRCERGVLDQVAGEPWVALLHQRRRPHEHGVDPARQRDPLPCLLGAGAGSRLSGSPSYQPP